MADTFVGNLWCNTLGSVRPHMGPLAWQSFQWLTHRNSSGVSFTIYYQPAFNVTSCWMFATSCWRCHKGCVKGVLGLMTGWQKCNNRRGAVSTMTSRPSKEKDTSPFSEALYWCTAAPKSMCLPEGQSRHCPDMSHLLHRAPVVILGVVLIAFTETLLIFDW